MTIIDSDSIWSEIISLKERVEKLEKDKSNNPFMDPPAGLQSMKPENVKCPDCDGPMVPRKNRQSGEIFWGCKSYPECKGTRDNMGRSREERAAEKREESSQDGHDPRDRFRFRKR